ncbi:hypothetical protein [Rhodococcus sp. KRD162]|uniref:hypothetical protein n=1 Tax=Rhodococcus sp. KRD162 TaxID=2729725 RepID=UPI0019D2FFA5|nr:hypothetical protein [Rhodococcus sp. KRD162]
MAGKTRQVYFHEPFFVDDQGVSHEAPGGFWKELLDHIGGLNATDRAKRINGHRYRGAARSTVRPAVRFLYIGKRRPPQDWPDTSINGADEQPLTLDGELVEPMYLLPVGTGNYIASLRSSGGPSFAAAVEWIGQILQSQGDPLVFQMRSVVRHDALERLSESAGVVMFDLKLEAGADVPADAGSISNTVRELQAQGGIDMAIGLRLSFGNVVPDSATARELARDVEKIVRGGHGIKNAIARIVETNDDGTITKDEVQFLHDRITHAVAVGDSESQAQTPEVVMAAMTTATTDFRRNLSLILGDGSGDQDGT